MYWWRLAVLLSGIPTKQLYHWTTRTKEYYCVIYLFKGRSFKRHCCCMWSRGNGEIHIFIIYWNSARLEGYVQNRNRSHRRSNVSMKVKVGGVREGTEYPGEKPSKRRRDQLRIQPTWNTSLNPACLQNVYGLKQNSILEFNSVLQRYSESGRWTPAYIKLRKDQSWRNSKSFANSYK